LAARRRRHDESAAFAHGALWQLAADEQGRLLPRHPDVGGITTDQETVDELRRYTDAGHGENYDALIDDFRSPSDGRVEWRWPLIERLRPNPDIVGRRHDEIEAARKAIEPVLMELRDTGFAVYDLDELSGWKLPSLEERRRDSRQLVARVDAPFARSAIASALAPTSSATPHMSTTASISSGRSAT
jgi:hypothetical protein